jgi:3-methyladenine DNA glycosylase AlkD
VAEVCDALWACSIREEMVVAALIHGHDPASRSRLGLRTVERWTKTVDNWETADALGAWLVARSVADDPDRRYPMLETLVRRRNSWARRIGLVGCLGTARDPEAAATWWPRAAEMVLLLGSEKEAALPKAISWVLREHTRHTADEVAVFLDEHRADLPAIAVRETRNKLETGLKSGRR